MSNRTPSHKPKPHIVAEPYTEKTWGRPDPDCTGDPNLWPWVISPARTIPTTPVKCATDGCKRKPLKDTSLCRTCGKRQVQQWWDLKFGSKSGDGPPDRA